MEHFVSAVNFIACTALAGLSGWAVVSDRIRDGIVIKLGLILISLGAASLSCLLIDGLDLADVKPVMRCLLMVNAGMLIILVGWLIRTKGGQLKKRRATDWMPLNPQDTQPSGHS